MIENVKLLKDMSLIKKISNIALYIALSLELIVVLLDKSDFVNPLEGRMFQITFCLFLVRILLTKHTKYEYCLFFIIIFLGILIDYYGNRNEVIRFATAVFAFKEIEIKKGLKLVFWIQTIGSMFIVLSSMVGLYGRLTVAKEYQGEGFFTRYCFGMGNANSFHTMFFSILLLGLYIYYEKLKWWSYAFLMVINLFLYTLTDSRTATILAAVTIISFSLLPRLEEKKLSLLRFLIKVGLIVDTILVFLSVYFAAEASRYCKYYWDSFWEKPSNPPYILIFFDKLLTGRILSLTEHSYEGAIESWKWFTVPDHNVYFDLGWIRVFYWYGIIPALIFIIILAYVTMWLYRNQKYDAVMLMILVFLHMFVEAHYVSVYIGRAYYLMIIGGYFQQIIEDRVKNMPFFSLR